MLEIVALALTLGAIFYHNLQADFFVLALITFSIIVFLSFIFRSRRGAVFSVLIGFAFILGAVAVWNSEKPIPSGVFGGRAFDAKVISVDRRLSKTNLIIKDIDHDAKLQLSFYGQSNLLPGDLISVRAQIEEPEAFLTDSGRLFDYPKYLQSKGIVGIGQNAQVILQKEGRLSFARVATIVRFSIADIFSKNVSFPVDGVVAGMTVGFQGGLPQFMKDLFRNTGVLHVLVLSGYNITLLAGFLGLLLRRLPFRLRTGLIIVSIIMLVIVSGSGIASIRAGIMGSIALFAGLSVRTYRPFRALVLAYLFFFFISPETIFSDPGFHLSFLATAFMILAIPKIEKWFSFIPKTRNIDIRELLMLAFTIPIFMLPYTMYFSGNFPIASPVANILLALLTPLLMVLGIFLIAVSWIAPLAHIVGIFISAIGNITIWLLELFSRLPNWNTPEIPWWCVTLFYTIILYFIFWKEIRSYFEHLRSIFQPRSNLHS